MVCNIFLEFQNFVFVSYTIPKLDFLSGCITRYSCGAGVVGLVGRVGSPYRTRHDIWLHHWFLFHAILAQANWNYPPRHPPQPERGGSVRGLPNGFAIWLSGLPNWFAKPFLAFRSRGVSKNGLMPAWWSDFWVGGVGRTQVSHWLTTD